MLSGRSIDNFVIVLLLLFTAAGCRSDYKVIIAGDFSTPLDTSIWVPEIAPLPDSRVYTQDGRLVLDTRGGVTVWFNKILKDNTIIEFDRKVIVEDGVNDRLSDMNMFWMASDPHNSDLFTRKGFFEEYDSLQLYYAGIGGNHNTTTRFRKYEGDGTRTLLQEYEDAGHLLKPDHTFRIKIEVTSGTTTLWEDGLQYFTFTDPVPLKEGYFGFRSTWSHQEISNFRVLFRRSSPGGRSR